MSSAGEMTADSDSPPSCSQLSSSDDENHVGSRGARHKPGLFKPNLNDTFDRRIEFKTLQAQLIQHQSELTAERETSINFRRKLTSANKEKFEQAAKFNEETCRLMTQNAALQAKLERQSEYTEELQYELDRAKRDLQNEQKASNSKAAKDAQSMEQLEELLNEYKARISTLQEQQEVGEKGMQAQVEQLKETIGDRDRILRETVQEQQSVLSERNSLTELVQQQQETIQQHRKEFGELKAEFEKVRRHLSDANSQVKSLTAAEQQHRADIESLQQTNRELSEAIESEKTNHLESKFNSELVQLKINDLQNSLEHQKCVNEGLQENVDSLTGQLRELEQAYNDEMNLHRDTKAKLDKCEKEYTLSQRQLQAELTDKRTLVTNLKQQLDMHQSNVDDLKSELNRARKRQQYFEETYGGSMRELELLVANFDLAPVGSASTRESRSGENKQMSPSAIMDMIKHTLRIYKQNLELTTAELKKVSVLYEEVSKEKNNNNDKLWAKEKALEEAQKSLSQATRELDILRKSAGDQDHRLSSLREEMKSVKKEYDSLQRKYTSLSDELTKTKMHRLEKDEQKMRFIHGLYQRLISPTTASGQSHKKHGKVESLEKVKWDELSELVLEQTVTVIAQVNQLREALSQLDKEVKSKNTQLQLVEKEREAEVALISDQMEKNKLAWADEREELEKQHQHMQEDKTRQQMLSQKAYDEVWEQMRQTTDTVEQLERESTDLKTRICLLQKHNSSLLCALALLCGAYFPLVSRSRQLSLQRNILEDQLHRYEHFKKQVCTLLLTLNSECLGGAVPAIAHSSHSLLKFRKAALAIIAARRLRLLPLSAKRVFTFTDRMCSQAVVCLGSLNAAGSRGSRSNSPEAGGLLSESDVREWLSNKEVISTILSCTEDVMEALKRFTSKDKVCRPGFLVSACRTSLKKLTQEMGAMYPSCTALPAPTAHKERHSTVRLLARGLHEVMGACQFVHKYPLLPSQQVLTGLQERVLGFIKLLHDSELERRRLRGRVKELSGTEEQLHKVEQTADNLELELSVLRNQAERMVSVDKFDGVVEELNQTLAREKRAQQLLDEQTNQLKDMGRQLEVEEARRREQESEVKAMLKSIEQGKDEVSSKSEAIHQLKHRLSQLELERTQLQDNVIDAEQAMRTAAKDKEYMSIYVKSLTAAFDKCRANIIEKDVSKILNSKSLFPDCKPTIDMLAIESLVTSFTDSLRALHNHMTGLNDEISSHKKHIARLKDELSAACRRQLSGPAMEVGFDHMLPGEDYSRMQSTRLAHYQDRDITPRFDKSLDLDNGSDFVSMRNEPEFSNADTTSIKNVKRKDPVVKPPSKAQSSSFRPPSTSSSRRKRDTR